MRWFALLAAFAISACSSGPTPLPHSFEDAHPIASSGAILRIVVPHRRSHAHYISPATQSIAIAVRSAKFNGQFNADLSPATNPDCSGAYICTIVLPLPAGRYHASVATYDGPLAGGNAFTHPPTGNELSADGDVPLSVRKGRPTLVKLTLGGIPSHATMVSYADTGFTLSKCSLTDSVGVFGSDADGNLILGPGAPSVALASSDTQHLKVTSTPAPKAPNTFVLSRPTLPQPDSTLTLTATVTASALTGITTHVQAQQLVTFNRDICGTFTHATVPTANAGVFWGITSGPDGAMWFTEYNKNKIGRVTTDGAFNEYTNASFIQQPIDINVDASGTLWFTDRADGLATIATDGTVKAWFIGISSAPTGYWRITPGPDNTMWFSAFDSSHIGYERPLNGGTTVNESWQLTPTSNSHPMGIAEGPDGNLWFTESDGNNIGRTTTGFTISEFPLPTHGSEPLAIVAGPDGAMWFTECASNKIGRISTGGVISEFAVPSKNSSPGGIVAGPDGALWFAESSVDKIGRLTTDGVFTEIPITGANGPSGPLGITVGPDHNLWFTETTSNQIGRLQ